MLFFQSLVSISQIVDFKQINTKHGLPSNEVYHMFQDKQGYIWFATDHCISRYDGNKFEYFGLKDGLTSNTILRFYPQSNGDVWCSTINNEFFYFNPEECKFIRYKYNDVLSKAANGGVNDDLVLEEDGTLHVGFIDMLGIISINKEGVLVNKLEKSGTSETDVSIILETLENGDNLGYVSHNLPNKKIKGSKVVSVNTDISDAYYHKADAKGKLTLLADVNSVHVFHSGRKIRQISAEERVIGLGFIGEKFFWVGRMYGGVSIFDLDGNEIETYLDGESVSCLITDHEGGTWISTISSGIYYASSREIKSYQFEPNTYVHGLSRAKNNGLIATLYDGTIYRYDSGHFNFSVLSSTKAPSFAHYYSSIDAELTYLNSRLWQDDTFIDRIFIRKFSESWNRSPLFVGKHEFFELKNGKLEMYTVDGNLRDVCYGKDYIYLAGNSGLYTYDPKTKEQKKIDNSIVNCRVSDIDAWRGDIIMATYGNGIGILKNEKIYSITTKEGLSSNIVREVYVENDSIIWACTNAGVNRIVVGKKLSFDITSFSYQDGLIDNAVTDIEVIDNIAWVATRSGISSFPIALMKEASKRKKYFLRLLEIKVNGLTVELLDNLDYWQNKVELNFQAISFKGEENLNYRYKLIGIDKHWNYTSSKGVIYEALLPGEYSFILQVGSKNQWSPEKIVVPIVISPAFYQTAWFKIVIVFTVFLLIYFFFKLRVLVYNRDLMRELLRLLLKRFRIKNDNFTVRESGNDVKVSSSKVLYAKSLGNYLEIYTADGKVITREKISTFLTIVPDPIEYIKVHRSYIVRIDKIDKKGPNSITLDGYEIKIGKTFTDVLSKISLH
ncbi:MAG: ligand-binding sensor domain-containing protein [Flavobacteriaceae bacterium]|jgi:ligand-binding sensor domain-containing protein